MYQIIACCQNESHMTIFIHMTTARQNRNKTRNVDNAIHEQRRIFRCMQNYSSSIQNEVLSRMKGN